MTAAIPTFSMIAGDAVTVSGALIFGISNITYSTGP